MVRSFKVKEEEMKGYGSCVVQIILLYFGFCGERMFCFEKHKNLRMRQPLGNSDFCVREDIE